MQEAMTRPRREGYNAVIDTAKGILRMVRANKERLPDCNYSGLEATAEFLAWSGYGEHRVWIIREAE